MPNFDGKNERELSDSELKSYVQKYRVINAVLLIIGAILTLFLIWQENESDAWALIYIALMIGLLPNILKANALHRELRSRYYERRRKERDKQKKQEITIKLQ